MFTVSADKKKRKEKYTFLHVHMHVLCIPTYGCMWACTTESKCLHITKQCITYYSYLYFHIICMINNMTAIEPPCFYSHSIWTKQSQMTFTEKWVCLLSTKAETRKSQSWLMCCLSYSICEKSLTSWGRKFFICSAGNSSIFKVISVSKIHKEYLIWNYIQICFCQPVNVFITCLRHAYFSNHIINCLSLKCHLAVTDNSKTVMRRLFVCLFLFWLDNSPFESCNHWSCLLIMFGYVSTRLSRLDTNCHCLHSKYLPTTWP